MQNKVFIVQLRVLQLYVYQIESSNVTSYKVCTNEAECSPHLHLSPVMSSLTGNNRNHGATRGHEPGDQMGNIHIRSYLAPPGSGLHLQGVPKKCDPCSNGYICHKIHQKWKKLGCLIRFSKNAAWCVSWLQNNLFQFLMDFMGDMASRTRITLFWDTLNIQLSGRQPCKLTKKLHFSPH